MSNYNPLWIFACQFTEKITATTTTIPIYDNMMKVWFNTVLEERSQEPLEDRLFCQTLKAIQKEYEKEMQNV